MTSASQLISCSFDRFFRKIFLILMKHCTSFGFLVWTGKNMSRSLVMSKTFNHLIFWMWKSDLTYIIQICHIFSRNLYIVSISRWQIKKNQYISCLVLLVYIPLASMEATGEPLRAKSGTLSLMNSHLSVH